MLAFGPLAFVNLSERGEVVFNWLVALSGLSTLFTWGTICLCHIRFRKAWRAQGHALEELPFRAMFGVWGSWLGLGLLFLVLVAQFYIAISPISGTPSTPGEVASNFFQSYLALPVVVLFYIIGYVWKRTTPQRAQEIDLDVSPALVLYFHFPSGATSAYNADHVRSRGGVLTALLTCATDRSQVLVHRRANARVPR